jgi:hypothetical protein
MTYNEARSLKTYLQKLFRIEYKVVRMGNDWTAVPA